ncbi:hypothetical protein Glove_144g29 [Diversispora epigaea]|uniref:Uncharacterized protein n=1 Tax=Diversispora epigaea TaxID=1348612 RepID=A0A397IYW0_9GLOM|nr:hypothetical protein Glove_144g29 [Diversispora epigaea]
MLGIGHTHLKNVRNHLATNGVIPRVHGNYNARKEEANDLLKKYKEHLVKAKLERNYYNKNTKLAEQRKLVDGKIYYLSSRKVHLFDIQDEAVCEQINYVLDEDEIIGKGPNVICGYYESIELNFMVSGHTKFKCDGSFGLIKKLYRKTTVDCMDYIVEVVKRSSTAGLNKAQCYDNGKGFQYLDLNSIKASVFEITKEIKSFSILVLTPPPLDYKRQEYLYHNIRPFIRDEFKHITCPRPIYTGNE